MRQSATCVVCGDRLERNRGARGDRCLTCGQYKRRTGVDRPFDLIRRQTERDIERELERRRR